MRNILRFLMRYSAILLFVVLESFSLYLLFNFNNFQQSTFFSTANRLNGYLYSLQENVTVYFNLKPNNEALLKENNRLLLEVASLKSNLAHYTDTTKIPLLRMKAADEYTLIPARVIQNSVTHLRNYVTLNAGSKAGISVGMGVADADGIIGVVSMVSKNYAIVIPVLHNKQRFSCKLKQTSVLGSLAWDGVDRRYAYLEEVPPYVRVKKGDTVVTNGLSAIFPEGIMVGTVENIATSSDANYLRLKVRLSTRFDAISNVRVIRYTHRKELIELEDKLDNSDKEVLK